MSVSFWMLSMCSRWVSRQSSVRLILALVWWLVHSLGDSHSLHLLVRLHRRMSIPHRWRLYLVSPCLFWEVQGILLRRWWYRLFWWFHWDFSSDCSHWWRWLQHWWAWAPSVCRRYSICRWRRYPVPSCRYDSTRGGWGSLSEYSSRVPRVRGTYCLSVSEWIHPHPSQDRYTPSQHIGRYERGVAPGRWYHGCAHSMRDFWPLPRVVPVLYLCRIGRDRSSSPLHELVSPSYGCMRDSQDCPLRGWLRA